MMADAMSTDLATAGFEVQRMADATVYPLPKYPSAGQTCHTVSAPAEEKPLFTELARSADATLVIAPETAGALTARVRWTLEAGGMLIGPDLGITELATDKHQLAEHLLAHGIPAVAGIAIAAGSRLPTDVPYPVVLKPRDGAGSQQMHILRGADAQVYIPTAARLEPYIEGLPVSVSLLAGPSGICPLPACRQLLSKDGKFTYLGGSLPLDSERAERAKQLALRAVAACGTPCGYLGVDLILGKNMDADRVIEINPRLTTSYLLLRQAAEENLAAAIIGWSLQPSESPIFSTEKKRFLLNKSEELIA